MMRRFELVPGRHRPRRVRNGAIFLGLLAVALYLGFTRGDVPFAGGDERVVRAHFERATNLREGHPVRVAGVNVGEVASIERAASGDGVVVSMRIEDPGVVVKADARASMWWRTLFGRNMYVALEPGSPSAPTLGEQAIPRSRTSVQVEFDELLAPFDRSGRAAVQTALAEFDRGFADDRAAGEAIDRLAPTMGATAPALATLGGERPGDLSRLVARASRAMGAVGGDEARLARLIDGGSVVLGVTAARRADLGELLRQAPATLRDTRTTMLRLRETLDELAPAVDAAIPGARRLDAAARSARPALLEAAPLLRDARPLLRALAPASRSLGRAAAPGTRALRGLDPTLRRATGEVFPFLRADGSTGLRNVDLVGPLFGAYASAMGQFDTYGHMHRFQQLGSEHSITTIPCDTFFADPNAEELVRCDALEDVLSSLFGGQP